MSDKLFDSYTKPIPPFRRDVQMFPVEQNGKDFMYFYDQKGYATPDFAVPSSAQSIFSLFDGRNSVEDIMRFSAEEITKDQVLDYVRFLDENALLESPYFRTHSEQVEEEYEEASVHPTNSAGISYPEDAQELTDFLNEAFEKLETSKAVGQAKALYAPHIDFRVGLNSYVKAFSAISELKPKRVILLGTSHYSGLYPDIYENRPFVISEKDYHLTNGTVKSDTEGIDQIKNRLSTDTISTTNGQQGSSNAMQPEDLGITFQDRAHRIEHSIELHLLFLNHLWDHDFSIIPILVGGLDEIFYKVDGFQGEQVQQFSTLIQELFADDKDTFFLISGDLAHIGQKFGDSQPAKEMLDEIRSFDESFLDFGAKGNAKQMLELMSEKYDPYRICGYPPLYSFLNIFPGSQGEVLTYDIWDEQERHSAVSFGSILY
ncbi:MAG: AmmeMemoRadiSam system protein B [Balneolaceae bacterium]|nr:AmmeMemoRadiSam system protein B [Balneolaceae bacterium]